MDDDKNNFQNNNIYNGAFRPRRSPTITKLAEALSKAQGQMLHPEKSGKGNYGPYSTIADTWNAIRKPLADNGIAILQRPLFYDGKIFMATMLLHSSGEFIDDCELELRVDGGNRITGMQALGSAITYARRYSLEGVVGVASEDDDGATAGNPKDKPAEKKPAPQAKPEAPKAPSGKPQEVSTEQLKRLFTIGSSKGWDTDDVKEHLQRAYGVQSSKELTRAQYDEVCAFIEQSSSKKKVDLEPGTPGDKAPGQIKPASPSAGPEIAKDNSIPKDLILDGFATPPATYVITAEDFFIDLNGKAISECAPEDLKEFLKHLNKEISTIPAPKGLGKMIETKRKIEKYLGIKKL